MLFVYQVYQSNEAIMNQIIKITLLLLSLGLYHTSYGQLAKKPEKIQKTNAEWSKILSPEVYEVARLKGTERPFTSKYETSKEIGTYYCAVCGNALFKSDTKFDSGCGWPSFYEPISKQSIVYHTDKSHGMVRTEVVCGKCDSHLGHVFKDGPPPTGLRYCINGVVLDFTKAQTAEKAYNAGKKPKTGSR